MLLNKKYRHLHIFFLNEFIGRLKIKMKYLSALEFAPTCSFCYLNYFKNEKGKLNIEFRRFEMEPKQLFSLRDVQVYVMENSGL